MVKQARSLSRAALVAGLFLSIAPQSRAQTNIAEFPVPANLVEGPEVITLGPDGAYWFAEFVGPGSPGIIGRIDTISNAFTQFGLLTNRNAFNSTFCEPYGITRGPNNDTNLWFTESNAGQIGRIGTNGNYQEFPMPNGPTTNSTITPGPDGNLWFVEFNLNRLAAITPAPLTNVQGNLVLVHEYGPFGTNTTFYGGMPGTNAYMNGLISGSDGNLWFTQGTYGTIGKLNPASGAYTLYSLPGSNCEPYAIVQGVDGAFWFSEFNSNTIGRITTSGQISEFPLPLISGFPFPEPAGVLAAPDGSIWFCEYGGSAVGRVTPTGIITIFPTPTAGSVPTFLATGPDGNIWFCENVGGNSLNPKNIGRLLVAQSLSLSLPATNITGTTFNGLIANFQNSTSTNTVTITWGDGQFSALTVAGFAATNSFSVTNVVAATPHNLTNTLTITQVAPVDTNTGNNGSFSVSVNHTYATLTNSTITVVVTDPRFDTATGHISANSQATGAPPLFTGEHISNGELVLTVNGVSGRTYTIQTTGSLTNPAWITDGTVTVPTNATTAQLTNVLSSSNLFFRLTYP